MPECERIADQRGVTAACVPQTALAPELDLSVCIVNWNCRDVLRGCLHSLREQSLGVRYEVIVVDNASADGAADMVCAEFPEVCLLRNDANVGFARANNQAAAIATGRFLFFLNNDTLVPAGALQQLVSFLETNPDVVMAGPRLRDARGKLQASHRRQPTLSTFLYRTWTLRLLGAFRGRYRDYRRQVLGDAVPHDVEVLLGAALAMPRSDFQNMGRWDEAFRFGGEDLELCHRARRFGRIVYCPDIEITHLGSVSTKQHMAFASPHIAAGFVRFFRKAGASRIGVFCYKLAVTLDAPPRLLARLLQWTWRTLRGREHKARKCGREAKGLLAFLLRGLPTFWRA